MRLRSLTKFPIALLAAAVLSACTSSSPPQAPPAAAPSEYGGRFVYPLRNEPTTLNFVTAGDQTSDLVARLVGDGLVDRDVELKIVPRLASSWEFSDGGR